MGKEGVVCELGGDGGEWAVSWAKEGVGWEVEDVLADGVEGLVVVLADAANGACEEGIADDGDGLAEPGYGVGGATWGVARSEGCGNLECADGEGVTGGEGLRALERLELADAGGGAGFFDESVELNDVVAVGVGEEDLGNFQVEFGGGMEDGVAIGAGVEGGGLVGGGVPHEEGVDGEVAEGGLEGEEPAGWGDGVWRSEVLGESCEGIRVKAEEGCDPGEEGQVELVAEEEVLDGALGEVELCGDFLRVKFKPGGSFLEDVAPGVFEGNCHGLMRRD